MADENGRVTVKTRQDFDELNALSVEDIMVLHEEFGYEFEIKAGKIVAFSVKM